MGVNELKLEFSLDLIIIRNSKAISANLPKSLGIFCINIHKSENHVNLGDASRRPFRGRLLLSLFFDINYRSGIHLYGQCSLFLLC